MLTQCALRRTKDGVGGSTNMFDPVSDGLDKNNNRPLALTLPIPLVSATPTVQERVSCRLYQ